MVTFTFNFFARIAKQPEHSERSLGNALTYLHTLALPLFLAGLEFITITLACLLWQRVETSKDRSMLLLTVVLFVAAQSFPVLSVYTDVMESEYQTTRKARIEAVSDQIEKIETANKPRWAERAAAIKNELLGIQSQISKVDKDFNKQVTSHLNSKRSSNFNLDDATRSKDERLKPYLNRRKELETELKSFGDETKNLRDQLTLMQSGGLILGSVSYETAREYTLKNVFTIPSLFAAFVSLLFPITILAFAFVLTNSDEVNNKTWLSGFSLASYLNKASSLPVTQQALFVRIFKSCLAAYLQVVKATNKMGREITSFELENEAFNSLDQQLIQVETTIDESGLTDHSKQSLKSTVKDFLKTEIADNEASQSETNRIITPRAGELQCPI